MVKLFEEQRIKSHVVVVDDHDVDDDVDHDHVVVDDHDDDVDHDVNVDVEDKNHDDDDEDDDEKRVYDDVPHLPKRSVFKPLTSHFQKLRRPFCSSLDL